MATIALFGAGGKMGLRATDRLCNSEYTVKYVEISPRGIEELKKRGIDTTPAHEAIEVADILIAAVPDILIGKVLCEAVPNLKTGAMVITLDPAAAYAGVLPDRKDISYFVTHPCHPSVFNDEEDIEARRDYFGAIKAKQSIVCALLQGPEKDFAKGEAVAKKLFSPILNSHRITVGQMALLEPALAETLSATCISVIKEGLDHVISMGVPADAAKDFIMGHINTALAIVFGQLDTEFSDGCKKAIERAKQDIFKPDWMKIFDKDKVLTEVEAIAKGAGRC
jgi:D-apionate oxidoisomerase